jgi:hypothetical protein
MSGPGVSAAGLPILCCGNDLKCRAFQGVLSGESMMRTNLWAAVACILFASPALADGSPLSPGKPAGVQKAQFYDGNGIYIVAGAAL